MMRRPSIENPIIILIRVYVYPLFCMQYSPATYLYKRMFSPNLMQDDAIDKANQLGGHCCADRWRWNISPNSKQSLPAVC